MDKISAERRSANMKAIRSADTSPEMIVRRLVYHMGYRYRLHRRDLPGKPDLVFAGRQKIVFIHGCFWHQHGCRGVRPPKSNYDYWLPKLERTKQRDKETNEKLADNGWDVLIIWECELRNLDTVAQRLKEFLGK